MRPKESPPTMSPYVIPGIRRGVFSHQDVIHIACRHLSIDSGSIFGKSRKRELVNARQVCMYFMRKFFPEMSLASVGEVFKKDHATVLHSIRVVKDQMFSSPAYKMSIEELMAAMIKSVDERKQELNSQKENEIYK